jgi:type I restriction enzyme S subunit
MRLLQGDAFLHHCSPEMTGISVPHISPMQIENFSLALPPIAEQVSIVSRLSYELSSIDSLTDEAGKAVGLLEERRSALISAAVSGKIDLRDFTAEAA